MIKINKSILASRKKVEQQALKKATTEKFIGIIKDLNDLFKVGLEENGLSKSGTSGATPAQALFNMHARNNLVDLRSTLTNGKLSAEDIEKKLTNSVNFVTETLKSAEETPINGENFFDYKRFSSLVSNSATNTNYTVNGVKAFDLIEACGNYTDIGNNGCKFYVDYFNLFLVGANKTTESDAQITFKIGTDINPLAVISNDENVPAYYVSAESAEL